MSFEKKWAWYLLGWAGIIIVLFYWGIIPTFQQVDSLAQERDRLYQEALTLRKKVQQLEALEKQLNRLQKTAQVLEERIPSETEIPNLLLTIEDASFFSQAEILLLTPQGIQKMSDYAEMPLQASLRSSFQSFLFFLNYLRQSPRLIQVKGFSFRREQELFTVNINFSIYLLALEGSP